MTSLKLIDPLCVLYVSVRAVCVDTAVAVCVDILLRFGDLARDDEAVVDGHAGFVGRGKKTSRSPEWAAASGSS